MTQNSKPNIVFIFPDQWRGDCFGHLGHPDIRTPWCDQLAEQGASYTRCFSPAPTCIPARMALMTGMSPWRNGRTGYEEGVDWRPPHSLPAILRDNGYQTMQVGKTHFHPMRAHLGFEINDAYEASIREPGYISDYHRELQQALPRVEDAALRRHPNAWVVTPWTAERAWHCSEWISSRAIERIQQHDPQRPFFMQIAYHRPHPPFDPPMDVWQTWRERSVTPAVCGDWVDEQTPGSSAHAHLSYHLRDSDSLTARRGYYACIEHVDEQIGRIHWALQQQGLLDHTWIVISSDHGECLGDHQRWHKAHPTSACARIPLIIRPPRGADAPRGLQQRPTLLTDLMPSFLHWAGIDAPAACDARPLHDEHGDWIHAEHHNHHNGWHALYHQQWAWHWHSDGSERLFDHQSDPLELHDCIGEQTALADKARTHLIKLLHQRGCGTSNGKQLKTGHAIGPTQQR